MLGGEGSKHAPTPIIRKCSAPLTLYHMILILPILVSKNIFYQLEKTAKSLYHNRALVKSA